MGIPAPAVEPGKGRLAGSARTRGAARVRGSSRRSRTLTKEPRSYMAHHRIGLIVPSSNVTVETELPALLQRHPSADFSFHSTRMRMHTVSAAQLASMNAQRERCTMEIADASPDVILYACLVAVMASGPGEHRRVEGAIA